ncbi:hypothetical protein E4U43_006354 [Claviceps pusilla]|uniref:Uncharacterized protein n=1 Tax=Claviceps pusilla TaxID=123648 RepID=A0A9P7T289_9HYPO|nr:hypothetical protein E4U43_006354 [Claviceps pusilla]
MNDSSWFFLPQIPETLPYGPEVLHERRLLMCCVGLVVLGTSHDGFLKWWPYLLGTIRFLPLKDPVSSWKYISSHGNEKQFLGLSVNLASAAQ